MIDHVNFEGVYSVPHASLLGYTLRAVTKKEGQYVPLKREESSVEVDMALLDYIENFPRFVSGMTDTVFVYVSPETLENDEALRRWSRKLDRVISCEVAQIAVVADTRCNQDALIQMREVTKELGAMAVLAHDTNDASVARALCLATWDICMMDVLKVPSLASESAYEKCLHQGTRMAATLIVQAADYRDKGENAATWEHCYEA